MKSTGWVLGYHGCDAAVGEAVLRGEKTLSPSGNDYDWLGSGIYFWENDPNRALEWATFAQTNPEVCKTRIKAPFALGAIIDLGNCLDLTESDSIAFAKLAHDQLVTTYESQGWEKPKNEGTVPDRARRKLDCAVINFLHLLREPTDESRGSSSEEPFDSVRALFVEGDRIYEDAGFMDRTHVQLALRREANIIGYFRPRLDRL
jgi:hypothetical protein